jgi:hypothetical protein
MLLAIMLPQPEIPVQLTFFFVTNLDCFGVFSGASAPTI